MREISERGNKLVTMCYLDLVTLRKKRRVQNRRLRAER